MDGATGAWKIAGSGTAGGVRLGDWIGKALSFRLLLSLVGLAAMVWGIIVTPYYTQGAYYYQDAPARRDMAGEFDLLISGSSQGLRAIDPRVLDEALGCRGYNLGMPLQTMYGRYILLKQELERNPVSTVIIELSYDALARSYEPHGFEGSVYQLGRSDSMGQWLDYFVHEVPPRDWGKMLNDSFGRGIYAWDQLLKTGPYEPFQYQTQGFLPGLVGTPMPTSYETDYHKETLPTNVEEENLHYLDKCLELCRERGIETILISTPLSEYKLWSCAGFDAILATHREISEKWGVPLYDFNLKKDKLSRYPEEAAFYDQHHLCEEGAKAFPYDLAEVISAAREGRDVSGEFYGSYEEAIRARRAGG